MYAADSHVDGMLFQPLVALYSYQITLDVVVDRSILQMVEVNAFERGELVDFLLVGLPYVRSQIEVECRNRLTACISFWTVSIEIHASTAAVSILLAGRDSP